MSWPEKKHTPWEEMWISKTKFTYLVIKNITWRVGDILKKWVITEIHPKGNNYAIAFTKGFTAYLVANCIWYELNILPDINSIVEGYSWTIETTVEIYENRESTKEYIIEVLEEKDFRDYLSLIWEIFSWIWNIPFRDKLWWYLELSVVWNIFSHSMNLRNRSKSWRNIFQQMTPRSKWKGSVKIRYIRMKKYIKDKKNKEDKSS